MEQKYANKIKKARESYFNNDTTKPVLSDDEYDKLIDKLTALNPKHPLLTAVGAPVAVGSKKVNLPVYMGSLDKIKTEPVFDKWIKKHPAPLILMDKLDGISALVKYEKNKLKAIYTRGDGLVGTDITPIAPHINGLPKKGTGLIRGELVISKNNKEFNDKKRRNIVSGAVGAKELDINILKHIDFIAYEIIDSKANQLPFDKQLELLKKNKFKPVAHVVLQKYSKYSDLLKHFKQRAEKNDRDAYEIDGIVIASLDPYIRTTSKNPSYIIGFKDRTGQKSRAAETEVINIEWKQSKDGLFKPVIIFNPVVLDNSNIQRATGKNAKYVLANKIGIGAKIKVERSGDVIPEIVEIVSPSTNIPLPGKYEWTESGVDIKSDIIDKDGVLKDTLQKIFKNLGIGTHFNKTVADKMVSAKKITVLEDIASIKAEDLKSLNISDKKITAIIEKLASLTEDDKIHLIIHSNLLGRGFSKNRLKLILNKYPTIFEDHTIEPENIELVGPKLSKVLKESLPKVRAFLSVFTFK